MTALNEKGLRDMLAGLAEVEKANKRAAGRAERHMAEAEAELAAARQVAGFLRIHREWIEARLREIAEEREREEPKW